MTAAQARLTVEGPIPSGEAMARDAAMLTSTEKDGIIRARVYEWDSVWITLGRNQDPSTTLLSDVGWTERPTGGKAVLHGHDVTVSFAIPVRERIDLHELYRTITGWIIGALNLVELGASVGNDVKDTSTADCFTDTGRFDLVGSEGNKLGGCAMRVKRNSALLQASIPYRAPDIPHSQLIRGAVDQVVRPWRSNEFALALANVLRSEFHELELVRGEALPDSDWEVLSRSA